MDTPSVNESGGLTRRQVLRRGAGVGAAVWVVPSITALVLNESAAAAASGSGHLDHPKKKRNK